VSRGPQGDPSNTDRGIVSCWLSVSGCDGRCRREFTEASSADKLNADESKERCDAEEVHGIRRCAEYQPAVHSTGRAAPSPLTRPTACDAQPGDVQALGHRRSKEDEPFVKLRINDQWDLRSRQQLPHNPQTRAHTVAKPSCEVSPTGAAERADRSDWRELAGQETLSAAIWHDESFALPYEVDLMGTRH